MTLLITYLSHTLPHAVKAQASAWLLQGVWWKRSVELSLWNPMIDQEELEQSPVFASLKLPNLPRSYCYLMTNMLQ
jgi:hypothetical protein